MLSPELYSYHMYGEYKNLLSSHTYGGMDLYMQVFLTSDLGGSKWSVSRSGHFTPVE